MGFGGRLVAAWLAAMLLVGLAAAPASADGGLLGAVTDAVLDEDAAPPPEDREAEIEPRAELSAPNEAGGNDSRSGDDSGAPAVGGVTSAVNRVGDTVGGAVEAVASPDRRGSTDDVGEERRSEERNRAPAQSVVSSTVATVTNVVPEPDQPTGAAGNALNREAGPEPVASVRSEPSTRNLPAATPVVGSVVEVAEPAMATIAEPVREAIAPVTESALPPAATGVDAVAPAALDPLADVLEPVVGDTVAPVSEVVEPVSRALDSTVAPLESTTRATGPVLTSVVEPLTEAVQPVVATAVEPVAATIEPAVVSAVQPLSDALEPVPTALERIAGTTQPVVDTSLLTLGAIDEALNSPSAPLAQVVAPLVAPIATEVLRPITPVAASMTDAPHRADSADETPIARPPSRLEFVDEAVLSPMPTGFDAGPFVAFPGAPTPIVPSASGVDGRPSDENARGEPTAGGVPATAGWALSPLASPRSELLGTLEVRRGVPTTGVSPPDSIGHIVSSSGLLSTGGVSGGMTIAALASFLLLATAYSIARRVCLDTRAPASWSVAPIPPPG